MSDRLGDMFRHLLRRPEAPPLPLSARAVDSAVAANTMAYAVLNARRADPLVCVVADERRELPVDPAAVRSRVGSRALLYVVVDDAPRRAVRACLPPRLGVGEGEIRLWWPGATARSDSANHPRIAHASEQAMLRSLARALRRGPTPAGALIRAIR